MPCLVRVWPRLLWGLSQHGGATERTCGLSLVSFRRAAALAEAWRGQEAPSASRESLWPSDKAPQASDLNHTFVMVSVQVRSLGVGVGGSFPSGGSEGVFIPCPSLFLWWLSALGALSFGISSRLCLCCTWLSSPHVSFSHRTLSCGV